jgi:hypothetical protein
MLCVCCLRFHCLGPCDWPRVGCLLSCLSLCGLFSQGAKVRYRKTEQGVAVRVAVKSGAIIPRSDESKLRKKPRPTDAGPSDTPSDVVIKETWQGMEAEVERAVRRRAHRRQQMLANRQAAPHKGPLPPRTRKRSPFVSQQASSEADERA